MKKNAFDLTGKVAVVTGSSKGIGRSIAEHLAYAGARVVISSRSQERCEPVAAAIRADGCEAVALAAHAGRKPDMERLVQQTRERWGGIDILVLNAAANPYYGPLLTVSDEAYHKTMDTNVLGNLWFCQLVMPGMAERGGGAVIVVSSVGAIRSTPGLGVYQISKAADLALVRALALEWGDRKVTVNAILPGLVKTDFARVLWETPDAEERTKARFPLKRLGEPDDIGPAAVYLASAAGQWMTGQSLIIDGGTTIGSLR
ncbi:MAG: SDR family oxidoreductase [Candidatus Lambdaproteobacteria bacterium]|nr:SDR family oxidoreductase [Candidatus Lambdaproteobacteria bacterium]